MQIANYKANGELITSAGSGSGAPTDATYITQTANGSLSAEQALASLSTGLMKVTTTTGAVTSVTDSAGLAGCLSDETGSGAAVFATAPTLVTPVVDGGADVVQLLVQAHSTQTNPIATIEKSDGTDLVTMGGTSASALVHIIGNADAQVQLKVKGSASQASNIVEVETSAGGDLFLVNASGGIVVNESGADTDSRIEGDTDANLLYIDAGQDAVAVGTNTPDDSAKFQVDSTTKGFLPPRLTTAQRDAVSSPIDGLLIYNSDTDVFNGYMNGAWGAVSGSGSGIATVQENGANVVTSADLLDFKDFNVEDLTGGDAAVYHNLPGICNGRLTLTTVVPVTTSNVTAAGTLRFTPFKGDKISLYDGTRWKVYTFSEVSLSLSLTAANMYDIWLYDNAGTLTLETLIWTNATTRATALATQNGVYLKTGALTRRYLGSLYASGTNTTEDSDSKRYLWNYYNRVPFKDFRNDTTDSWTDAGNGTWSAINAANAAWKHEFVIGVEETQMEAEVHLMTNVAYHHSIALDSATTIDRAKCTISSNSTSSRDQSKSNFRGYTGIGYHYLQGIETTIDGTARTAYGDNAGSISGEYASNSGLTVWGWR